MYINVTQVKDAPRIYIESPIYDGYQIKINEDTNVTLNFSVWDPDIMTLNGANITITSTFGTIHSNNINTNYWDITIPDSTSLLLSCINSGITHDTFSIIYEPNLHYNSINHGFENIQIITLDSEGLTETFNYYIYVEAINDPVQISCPTGTVTGYENIPLSFNWTVNDPDVNDNDGFIWVSIQSINGTFYFDITKTPTFIQTNGDITGNNTVLTGQTSNEGAQILLDTLRFMSLEYYYGTASITVSMNDQGNTGKYTSIEWSNCTQNITIEPVNDYIDLTCSLNNGNYYLEFYEDNTYYFEAILTNYNSTSDYIYNITIDFDIEILSLSFPNDNTVIITQNGNTSYAVGVYGLSNANALLSNISITPTSNFNGYITMIIEVISNDTANFVNEYASISTVLTRTFHVLPVNDGPIIYATSMKYV